MLGLILILLLTAAALVVLFWAGTLWFQAYLYSEPTRDLHWRAPAAAAALTLFLALWCFLTYRHMGVGAGFLDFSARQDKTYSTFRSVVEYKVKDQEKKEETVYELHKSGSLGGGSEYVVRNSRPLKRWRRTDPEGRLVTTIIVEEGAGESKKELKFRLKPPKDGKFAENEVARYVEEGTGRVMTEDQIGSVTTQRTWLVVLYLLLNLFHLVIWFVCLWLLLRFQWLHALGLALFFWVSMTLGIVPLLLGRAERIAPPPAVTASMVSIAYT